jgi:hypothetical protein
LPALLERSILEQGDNVVFDESKGPDKSEREWDPKDAMRTGEFGLLGLRASKTISSGRKTASSIRLLG